MASPSFVPQASGEASTSSQVTAKRVKLSHKLNYRDGLFLAPMVRCGTLPTRLLCLDYGASLVWGPETVDRAIIGTERTVDETSGTIKYMKKGKSIWETHPIEKSRLIYQIGSADPDLALQAAKIVQDDVAGVDLNCGCPKDFSLKGGMGAALLKNPDKLCAILRNLVDNLQVPVSAKIRLLPSQEDTIALVKQIIATGISCLTVHCRTQTMRPREPALLERLREIVDVVREYGIPVVANGDCWGVQDRDRICQLTGVTSIMIARGAEANPSCFSTSGLCDPAETILPLYTRLAMVVDNAYQNSKYCLYAMDLSASPRRSEPGTKQKRHKLKSDMSHLKDYPSLCELLGVDYEECRKKEKKIGDVLPDLQAKLSVQNEEIREEVEEELKRKLPMKAVHGVDPSESPSSGKENEPVLSSSISSGITV